MSPNRLDELKDKVVGGVQATAGKITDNEKLELKGKVRQGMGKAREVAGDVAHEVEDVKDLVMGTVKEETGKFTDDKTLQLKGKVQKTKGKGKMPKKLMAGAGALAGAMLIKKAADKVKENSEARKEEEK